MPVLRKPHSFQNLNPPNILTTHTEILILPFISVLCCEKKERKRKEKRERKALGTDSLDIAKSKRRKETLFTPGGKRKSSHPKRIMHGVTKTSPRKGMEKHGGWEELLWMCKHLREKKMRRVEGPPPPEDRLGSF